VRFLIDDPAAVARTIVVGVLAYAALVAILRVSGKRTLSQMNAFDFIVTVALGSTLATILISRDTSLVQGVVAFLVLIGLQFAITWSSVRSATVARLAKSEPRALVWQGQILSDAMRRERVVEAELHAAVRTQGIAALDKVDLVVLETDGSFTVIPTVDREAMGSAPLATLLPGSRPGDRDPRRQ
jgi:uncharacterized membrane protein YcaP (DUF421 family)